MAKRVLTIVAWSLCLLSVAGAAALLYPSLRVGYTYERELEALGEAATLILATYVVARAVTGIVRVVSG